MGINLTSFWRNLFRENPADHHMDGYLTALSAGAATTGDP